MHLDTIDGCRFVSWFAVFPHMLSTDWFGVVFFVTCVWVVVGVSEIVFVLLLYMRSCCNVLLRFVYLLRSTCSMCRCNTLYIYVCIILMDVKDLTFKSLSTGSLQSKCGANYYTSKIHHPMFFRYNVPCSFCIIDN